MRARGLVIAFAGTMLAGTIGWIQGGGMQHADMREAILLPAMQRDMLLGEMRGLLTSVNGILRGLATADTTLTRSSAASAGMAAMMRGEGMGMGAGRGMSGMSGHEMGGQGRGMGQNMPEGFRTLMHATRSGFDSLATRIAAGARSDTVVARLAALTNNCVSCHATYRLAVKP